MPAHRSHSRRKWRCLDCGIDTGKAHEHYFVHDNVWASAGMGEVGMLCIADLERRLGRQLTKQDFPLVSINNPKICAMSTRLLDRISK